MNLCLLVLFVVTDWHAVQEKIKEGRNNDDESPTSQATLVDGTNGTATETTNLL
jgi:hypothetical protein